MQLLVPCVQLMKNGNGSKMLLKLVTARETQVDVQMFYSFHISILNSLFRPVCLRIKLSQSSEKTYVEVGRVSWEKGLILSSYSAQLGPSGEFCLWNWVPFFVRGPVFDKRM